MISDRQPPRLVMAAVLLALSALLLFVGLGDMGLTDRDEGRNAEAGREMFASGDLVTPTFNGELRVAKPVFIYWLMTLSYQAFGVSEFAARAPSAVFGVALVLMQFVFLSRWRGTAVGFAGAFMLLLNVEMLALGRMAITDSVLIFFTTLSLYGFWLGLHGTGTERHWIWSFYVGMAVATLTKGPVGFLVPLMTVGLYLTAARRWMQFWRRGFPLAGALLFAALTIPWYAAMVIIHGDSYSSQAKLHTVGRFLSPMEGHGAGLWFYIPVLFFGFFPWSPLLPAALYQTYLDWRSRPQTGPAEPSLPDTARSATDDGASEGRELEWFAALWLIGTFVFFTLSSTRLPHYIGPLFPAASLLAASYWFRAGEEPLAKGIRLSLHATTIVGYLLAIGLACLPILYEKFSGKLLNEFPLATEFDLGIGPYLAAASVLIGMGLIGYFGLYREKRWMTLGVAGGTVAAVFLLALYTVVPGINRYAIAPPQELAYAAGVSLDPADQLIAYGTTRPSIAFYAQRRVLFVSTGEWDRLKTALRHPGRTMILLRDDLRGSLPEEAASFQPVLKQHGYVLLANQPMVTIPEPSRQPTSPMLPAH
ncbi:ArnT family glycosyltransferase [Candidatus Nitrospira inopinata]|uniref:Putative Glycosyl transferase, family 39 n=1 Tax=Candidatus Nitrospira inopinata TaxID=1715989 RepID=A0A0S4KNW9_9BACT|nr:glycosyltransferase family 39 protein [Candidatus Nitrospira inopinata]CUQ66140.1 putative Glycosyl transferase, family 39 [Candidatus Nitrospira inopinata]